MTNQALNTSISCHEALAMDGEPSCVICGGEGTVQGEDYLEWDDDGYDDLIDCPSCGGSGLAKHMRWC